MTRWLILSILLTLAAFGGSLYVYEFQYDRLPERVPIHSNIRGEPDGWVSKHDVIWTFLLMPAAMAGMVVLTAILPWLSPKPFDVAKEMTRVTRPGGRIVMGNWIPNDPTLVAQILKISSAYSPPPPEGFVSPMTWGMESNVIERFGAAGVPKDSISFVRDTYTFRFASRPAELVDAFRKYYGPTMNAFDAAEKNGRSEDLKKELDDLFMSQNESPVADATLIPATYLRVIVAR